MPQFKRGLLLDMLTYARPHGSLAEQSFCARFLAPLPNAYQDAIGNWHVHVSDAPVLWSAHTDTVHRTGGRQTIDYDKRAGTVQLSKLSRMFHSCLGADDTAGVAILVQMIREQIGGHYIFHTGEEVGGIGSSWLADEHSEWLGSFKCAIALDRKGVADVITHQYYRCCSDVFARSLAAALNGQTLAYAPSDSGVFTDTANYIDHIGECTNLSVGYAHAHSDRETLDILHVENLFQALCQLDTSTLVYAREAGDRDDPWPDYSYRYGYGGSTFETSTRQSLPYDLQQTLDDYGLGTCLFCGHHYDIDDSNAEAPETFCCAEDETAHDRCYLDRVYADVQSALKRDVH